MAELENIPEDILGQLHDPDKSNVSEVAYRLGWTRTYLRNFGLLENSSRGVWALTSKAKNTDKVDSAEVVKFVRALAEKRRLAKSSTTVDSPDEDAVWRVKLHHILTKKVAPDAFERLVQRLLRESGSVQASAIRDFRGAMVGRADKGLFITTGTFTAAAGQRGHPGRCSPN